MTRTASDPAAAVNRARPTCVVAAALLGAAAALYGVAALSGWHDVSSAAVAADAARRLASTGTDASGAVLPLFIHVHDALWLQPIPIYLMALAVKLSGGAPAAPSFVTAAVAVLDIVLTYLVARRLFGRTRPAVVSAVLLLAAPAHLVYGSTASPALYSVPFVLGWLLVLLPALDEPRGPRLFAAAALLGAGVYTHPEAVWTMAAYAALMLILLARRGLRSASPLLCAAAGFIVPLLPLVPWYLVHPGSYLDTMGRWAIHPAHIRNPFEGLGTFFRYDAFARRASEYWDFFAPGHLFFDAPAPRLAPLGGALAWPAIVLVPLGLYRFASDAPHPPHAAVIVWGFFVAPIAAAAFDEPGAIAAALALLPFAAMLGAIGIEVLLEHQWVGAHPVTASRTPRTPELRRARR